MFEMNQLVFLNVLVIVFKIIQKDNCVILACRLNSHPNMNPEDRRPARIPGMFLFLHSRSNCLEIFFKYIAKMQLVNTLKKAQFRI